MEEPFFDVVEFLRRPSIAETFVDILLCAVPIWLAVMIGLVIGWSWRPRWTGLVFLGCRSKLRFLWTAPPGFGARRLWLAFTALSAFSLFRKMWSDSRTKDKGSPGSSPESAVPASDTSAAPVRSPDHGGDTVSPRTISIEGEKEIVSESDLDHLLNLLEGRGEEMEWQVLMERSTPSMSYQAWRHEPETGPTVYRSRSVFEDATPELVRDFFWDDEFRPKWDPMLSHFKILEECPNTGTMVVHWIKKFPFFCSDREYIIGRRIWEAGRCYYCVTKSVPYPGLPKHDKPRRVELYFSSWIIRPVESRKRDGQMTACEVTLLHYEDMGIPKDVAKLGVRHGMWGAVKKLHSGVRSYQNARRSPPSEASLILSRSAFMAGITTKISLEAVSSEDKSDRVEEKKREENRGLDWKWIVLGGTVALVCGLHTGTIGKALLLGAGNRIARR